MNTRQGFRRLAIAAAILTGAATAAALLPTFRPGDHLPTFAALLPIFAAAAAAAAWAIVRLAGWVVSGFMTHKKTFPTPGKN